MTKNSSPFPVVTDAVAEKVAQAPDFQIGQAGRVPAAGAAIVRAGIIEADILRRKSLSDPVDPGDALLRGINLAISAIMEQATCNQLKVKLDPDVTITDITA